MHELSQVRFDMAFEFGRIADKTMQVTVQHQDQTITVVPDSTTDKAQATVSLQIQLPTCVSVVYSGKNNATDTVLDSEGNIVQDLYVRVMSIQLDGLALGEHALHRHCVLVTESDTINTAYVGFNGRMDFELDRANIFAQFYALNS